MLYSCFLFGNIFTVKIKESLALNLQSLKDAPIIELDTIDSTNNYAMRLIDADTAQDGLTIIAQEQTTGKGQRGRHWKSNHGQNLLMSIIVCPSATLDDQFLFNAAIAVAVAECMESLFEHWHISVKWPNDIIINDKKAGGVLIENVLRGSSWTYSIIGLGINVLQYDFPHDLPHAISLKRASGLDFNIMSLASNIRTQIFTILCGDYTDILKRYNEYLYRINNYQLFADEEKEWKAVVLGAGKDGRLNVQLEDGSKVSYSHGTVQWVW